MYPKMKPIAAAVALLSVCPVSVFAADKDLDPIVVTATRQASRASEVLADVTLITPEEIEKAGPATSIAELLATYPGVQYLSNGGMGTTSSVILRGGATGSHTLVLIDGIRNMPGNGGFTWQNIPLSQIDHVEILRGPASSLYGNDAIGGVVQIFTKRGEGPAQFTAEVGAGSFNTGSQSVGISGGTEKLNYNLRIANFGTDGINATTPRNSNYNPDADGSTNRSASGSLGYKLTNDTEIGTQILHTEGSSMYDSDQWTKGDYRTGFLTDSVNAYLNTKFADYWKSSFKVGHATSNYTTFTNYQATYYFNTTQDQYIWQNDIKTSFGKFLLATEQLVQDIDSSTAYATKERIVNSLVSGWQETFGNHLLQINGRHDDNSQFGKKTTGGLSYGYQLSDAWRISTSYGTAFRAPTFLDLYYPKSCVTAGSGCYSNPTLSPESSVNREGALTYETGTQRVRLTVFSNTISDMIGHTSAYYPINTSNAQIRGVTTDFSQVLGSFTLSFNYTQQEAKDLDTYQTLQNQADRYGSVSIGQKLGPMTWQVQGVGVGRRFANIDNKYEMGGYGLVNLYGSYQLNKEWNTFVRLNNVFDRPYELTQDYNAMGANFFVGVRYTPN